MKNLVIIGAGGHGKVVADTAREMAIWDRIVFVDTRFPELDACASWAIVSADLESLTLDLAGADFVIAIGNNELRLKLFDEALRSGFKPVNVIHPSAYVSPDVDLSNGIVVFANVVINIGSQLGKACIVNTGATIDHDCCLKDGVHISPGANLAGGVNVGACSWIGIGASVKQLVSIGNDVVVGAGAVVVSNITDGLTVVGTPAKELVK